MTDILKTEPLIIGASNVDVTGRFTEVSNCDFLTLTFVVSVSAATLVANFVVGGTNDDPLVSGFPVLSNGVLITVAPSGWTFTPATGILAASSPASGTHELTVSFSRFPKWIRPTYDFVSGGGTIDVKVIASTWSI